MEKCNFTKYLCSNMFTNQMHLWRLQYINLSVYVVRYNPTGERAHTHTHKHTQKESVTTRHFRLYCAGWCLKTMGRGGRVCRWLDCSVLGAQRQACDQQASWD